MCSKYVLYANESVTVSILKINSTFFISRSLYFYSALPDAQCSTLSAHNCIAIQHANALILYCSTSVYKLESSKS